MSANLTLLYEDYNTTNTSSTSWEMLATFWIEGVLTPVVSLGGLIGKLFSSSIFILVQNIVTHKESASLVPTNRVKGNA